MGEAQKDQAEEKTNVQNRLLHRYDAKRNIYILTIVPKYQGEATMELPCVVDAINFVDHMVLDVVQHKDQLFKVNDELSYLMTGLVIRKILANKKVKTASNVFLIPADFRRVRYYCKKIS